MYIGNLAEVICMNTDGLTAEICMSYLGLIVTDAKLRWETHYKPSPSGQMCVFSRARSNIRYIPKQTCQNSRYNICF